MIEIGKTQYYSFTRIPSFEDLNEEQILAELSDKFNVPQKNIELDLAGKMSIIHHF